MMKNYFSLDDSSVLLYDVSDVDSWMKVVAGPVVEREGRPVG